MLLFPIIRLSRCHYEFIMNVMLFYYTLRSDCSPIFGFFFGVTNGYNLLSQIEIERYALTGIKFKIKFSDSRLFIFKTVFVSFVKSFFNYFNFKIEYIDEI